MVSTRIYRHIAEREKSDDWYCWLLHIPIENAYVKIAGARTGKSGTIFEMYSKNGRGKKDHETVVEESFKKWFQMKFGLEPFDIKIPHLPEEIKLGSHSKDTKRILKNIQEVTGEDYSVSPDKLLLYYGLSL